MKRYLIEEAKCGISNGGMACGPVPGSVVASVKVNDGSKVQWLTMSETDGILNVSLSENDIYDKLIEEKFDDDFLTFMEEHFIDDYEGIELGSDYSDILGSISDDPDNPAVPVLRYLIALIRCEMNDVDRLINMAVGHYADELDIPVSDVEEKNMKDKDSDDGEDEDDEEDEDGEDYAAFDPEALLTKITDTDTLYRVRLTLEANLNTSSVFHDMDAGAVKNMKSQLKAVIAKCQNETDYKEWKASYIATEFDKLKGTSFITCTYMFAGIGQYDTTMPAEQKKSFICWINANGSAFYGGDRAATEEEIKEYIALMAGRDIIAT